VIGLGGLFEVEGQAGGRDADLAVVLGGGCGAGGLVAGARPQVREGQVRRAGLGGVRACLGCAGQEGLGVRRDAAGVGGLGEQQVRPR
jgi:hypothetical protein